MLHFIYGGAHQGKWRYVKETLLKEKTAYLDGHDAPLDLVFPSDAEALAFNSIHHWVRRVLLAERDPALILEQFLQEASDKDLYIIQDDLSSGLVPQDPFDRQFRAQAGRLSQFLSARADRVTRVVCGVPVELK